MFARELATRPDTSVRTSCQGCFTDCNVQYSVLCGESKHVHLSTSQCSFPSTSFRECPEVHTDIMASYELLEQLVTIIHCPSFSTLHGLMTACILSCTAQSPDVNKGLCRSNCLDGMMDAAQTRLALGTGKAEIMLFK